MKDLGPDAYENDMAYADKEDVLDRYSPGYAAGLEELFKSLSGGKSTTDAGDFDEDEHPRVKSGPGGGQFASKPKTLEEVGTKSYIVATTVAEWWKRFNKYVKQKPNGTSTHRWVLKKIIEEGEVRGLVTPTMKADMGKQIGWSFFVQAQKLKEKGGSPSAVAALEKKAMKLGFDVGAEKLGMPESSDLVPGLKTGLLSGKGLGEQKIAAEEKAGWETEEEYQSWQKALALQTKAAEEQKSILAEEKVKAGTINPDSIEAAQEISGAWKKTGNQAGSNPGGFYEDDKGNKWYVKTPKTDAHVKADLLANRLYSLTGVAVPYERPVKLNGKLSVASEIIPHAFPLNTFNANAQAEAAMKLRKDFAADAWLANWDVVGEVKDNVLVDANDVAWRVDQGGTLIFRAQGEQKPFPGMKVEEWDTLRDPVKNPQSASIFAGMSDDELSKSIDRVLSVSDEVIKKTVEDTGAPSLLAQILIDRKTILKAKQEALKPKKLTPILPVDQMTPDQKKAVKTTPIQLALLHPGAHGTPEVMAKIETFNKAWSGKVLTSMEELDQKIKAFAELKASINESVLESVAKQETKAAELSQSAIDKLAAKYPLDKNLKKNVVALAGVVGGLTSAEHTVSYAHAKLQNLHVKGAENLTPSEAALIYAYTNEFYREMNVQLRDGVMTPKQFEYSKALNRALKKLPPQPGQVYRKTTLPKDVFAKIKPGYIVEERAFTSCSTSQKVWSGKHRYTIQGKTGRLIKQLSNHPEQEVLFPMRSEFMIDKVEGPHTFLGDYYDAHILMTEVNVDDDE